MIYRSCNDSWVSYNIRSMATAKEYTTVFEFIYIAKMSEEPESLPVVEACWLREERHVCHETSLGLGL